MYVNRALLAAFGLFLVFLPSIEAWLFHADAPWYRPYALWGAIVFAAYWNQHSRRSRHRDEL